MSEDICKACVLISSQVPPNEKLDISELIISCKTFGTRTCYPVAQMVQLLNQEALISNSTSVVSCIFHCSIVSISGPNYTLHLYCEVEFFLCISMFALTLPKPLGVQT